MKANEIIGEGVLGGIGKVLQKVGGKMVDKSAASAEKAAAKAATKAASEPGVLGKAANAVAWPIKNPVKATALGVAGATVHNKLNDPSMSWGKAIGQGIKDTGNFLGDIYTGATGDESPMKTVQRNVDALPDPDQPEEETPGVRDDGDYVSKIRQRSAERFNDWPTQQNEDIKKKFALTEKDKEDPLTALQRGIYGQESSSGKAKTDKANYAGARGPMQIMPGTFDWVKKLKLIPQDYDIKNPKHNKEAGDALIAHYYKKYQGDPAKVAAAYYAGPGAINKDGTINTHWRDKKNPKAPTVGQYIDQTLAKANLPAAVGGAVYASSAPLGKSEFASNDKGTLRGAGAKPSKAIDPDEPITKAKITQPYYTASGPGPEETLAKTVAAQAQKKAAAQRLPTGPIVEPASDISKPPTPLDKPKNQSQTTGDPFRAPEPSTKPEEKPSTPIASREIPKDDSAWDKFINTVTVGRVPPEEKERIRVPESINKEIQDILRLAGKR